MAAPQNKAQWRVLLELFKIIRLASPSEREKILAHARTIKQEGVRDAKNY